MVRNYEIKQVGDYWVLKIYEDGEEIGGGKAEATDEGYQYLLEQASQACD